MIITGVVTALIITSHNSKTYTLKVSQIDEFQEKNKNDIINDDSIIDQYKTWDVTKKNDYITSQLKNFTLKQWSDEILYGSYCIFQSNTNILNPDDGDSQMTDDKDTYYFILKDLNIKYDDNSGFFNIKYNLYLYSPWSNYYLNAPEKRPLWDDYIVFKYNNRLIINPSLQGYQIYMPNVLYWYQFLDPSSSQNNFFGWHNPTVNDFFRYDQGTNDNSDRYYCFASFIYQNFK